MGSYGSEWSSPGWEPDGPLVFHPASLQHLDALLSEADHKLYCRGAWPEKEFPFYGGVKSGTVC